MPACLCVRVQVCTCTYLRGSFDGKRELFKGNKDNTIFLFSLLNSVRNCFIHFGHLCHGAWAVQFTKSNH